MNPIIRTLVFVGAAVLSLGAAGLTYWSHRPAQVNWSAELGEEFFPEFKDPNKATSLQVATFDKAAAKTNSFSVEYKNGKWRIPSHNNYPADGKDRLKSTAASVIGITRGTRAGTTKDGHKEHHLLDPLDPKITEAEGRGDRITLKSGDNVLVDYIIGKRKEGSSNTYFVRKADEDRFFLSEVKIELSTKFSDWIEPDLLALQQDDIQTIFINRYTVDEAQGAILPGERSILTRESATADWKIDGIDATTVKPKTSVINAMLKSFADLKIVGVRRKPEGLSASLSGDTAIKLSIESRVDLQDRGFFLHPKMGIASNEGEMLVSTFDGVTYVLRFGEVVTGSEIEIEAGSAQKAAKKPADPEKPEAADPTQKKNRYVFITAQFDEAALGSAPLEPKKPVAPKPDAAAPAADPAKPAEVKEGEPNPGEPKPGEKPAEPTAPVANPQAEAKAAYEAALKKYETDSDVYRIRKKEYDDKKTAGEKKAKQLNTRFADWYYVISEDLFTEIRVKPEDLVEPLVATPPGMEIHFPEMPPLPNVPKTAAAEGDQPSTEPAPPAEPKDGEKPKEDAVPAEKPVGEKPATEAAQPAVGDKPATETPKPAEPAPPTSEK